MATLLPSTRILEVRGKVHRLDLSPVDQELITQGWHAGRILQVGADYKKFLTVLALAREGEKPAPPTRDVLKYWRMHYGLMKYYYDDIIDIVGRFVNPPRFMFLARRQNAQLTSELWKLVFGTKPPTDTHEERPNTITAAAGK